jgi:hypothetical protein
MWHDGNAARSVPVFGVAAPLGDEAESVLLEHADDVG